MKLRVKAFGIARDILGAPDVDLPAAGIATVADLKHALRQQFPALGELSSVMIAVNLNYANDTDKIHPADEIALIPPTSGG